MFTLTFAFSPDVDEDDDSDDDVDDDPDDADDEGATCTSKWTGSEGFCCIVYSVLKIAASNSVCSLAMCLAVWNTNDQ